MYLSMMKREYNTIAYAYIFIHLNGEKVELCTLSKKDKVYKTLSFYCISKIRLALSTSSLFAVRTPSNGYGTFKFSHLNLPKS